MMRIYFGKVYLRGMEKLPLDKPLILAANHQSAFIEPVLLGGIMPFQVHFITRGDIFVKRWMWFFNAVNMVPIFRFHDGFKQMKRNMNSFQHVFDALDDGARIIIFCEGSMKWEKKLHNLQLGAARMAVGAFERNRDLDIHIVPIGINYENHLRFRRYVKISIGDPIRLADHTEGIDENSRSVLRRVTVKLTEKLRPEVIHIDTENHFNLGQAVLTMSDNDEARRFFPLIETNYKTIQRSIDVANATSKLDDNSALATEVQSYVSEIGQPFRERDYVLKHRKRFGARQAFIFFVIVTPLAMVGILVNGLPTFLSNRITHQRTSIPEFIGSVKSNLASFFVLLYYLLILIPVCFVDFKIGLILFPLMVVLAFIATYFWDRKGFWKERNFILKMEKNKIKSLVELRKKIKEEFA